MARRRTRSLVRSLVPCLGLLWLFDGCSACFETDGGGSGCGGQKYCDTDSDCEFGRCFDHECASPCTSIDDCLFDELCEGTGDQRHCVEVNEYCWEDFDCAYLPERTGECMAWRCMGGECRWDDAETGSSCQLAGSSYGYRSGKCYAGYCYACLPDCRYARCGSDGCGGSCGSCRDDQYCDRGWGECRPSECSADCVDEPCRRATCGHWSDGAPFCDWTPANDGSSCKPANGLEGWCDDGTCRCLPACGGRECGSDGCGDVCGSCTAPETCQQGWCEPCVPQCEGRVCGFDGCFGTCGDCGELWCSGDGTACLEVAWQPGSRLTAAVFPGFADESGDAYTSYDEGLAGAACLDVDGDEVLDDGLGALLGTLQGFGVDANAELAKALHGGEGAVVLFLEPGEASDRLIAWAATPGTAADAWVVDHAPSKGQPILDLAPASLHDGRLNAENPSMSLDGLVALLEQGAFQSTSPVTLGLARVVARVDGTVDAEGTRFAAGALGGVVYKADLDRVLFEARTWCATDPEAPADVCGYLQMADMSLIETFLTWDQDLPDCGKELLIYDANDPMRVVGSEPNCQGVSLCLFWAAEKARVALEPLP